MADEASSGIRGLPRSRRLARRRRTTDEVIRLRSGSRTIRPGTRILSDIDLDVSAGETLAIVGRSGSGKSTLLSCLGLISPFDRGTDFRFMGTDISRASDREASRIRAASIGFVLQNSGLISHLNATENVAVPLLHGGRHSFRAADRIAREMLDLLGIGHLARRRPEKVSGGERQRIAIARALAVEPRLILADEPTGALDEATGRLVLDEMLSVVSAADAALIVVTHDLDVAARLDRTLHMIAGELRASAEAPTA